MPRPTPATLGAAVAVTIPGNFKRIIADKLTADDFSAGKEFLVLYDWLASKGAVALPPRTEVLDALSEEDGPGGQAVNNAAPAVAGSAKGNRDPNNNDQDFADPGAGADAGAAAAADGGAGDGGGDEGLGAILAQVEGALMELAAVAMYTDNEKFDGWAKSHGVEVATATAFAGVIRKAGVPEANVSMMPSTWTLQRFSEQSTTTLVRAAYNSLGVDAEMFFGARPESLNSRAVDFQVDHGLEPRLIAKAYTYLQLVGYDFGGWYQGKRAAQEMAGPTLIAFKAALRAYLAVKSKAELLAEVESAVAIATYARDGDDRVLISDVAANTRRAAIIQILKEEGVKIPNARFLPVGTIISIAVGQAIPNALADKIRAVAAGGAV